MAYSGSVFKSVCEDILEPRGVKVGGYKDDIFDNLSEKEREDISCQICFMVAKDAHCCTNKHLFCAACIYAWSMTGEGNTDRCPVCRVRGSYSEEDSINARIKNMAIKCLKCKWRGHVADYRAHSHGKDEVGIDPKLAELPGVWSNTGDSVFPDLGTNESLDETVESSRRRHQRRYLDAQLDLIEGQARLAFLLDIFEEDLSRHRHNLNTLVRVQQRYNAEQFNEVMRLESELGQITANLLHLIDNASSDVDMMTNRLRTRGIDRAPASRPGSTAISNTIARLRSQRTELSSIPTFPLRASRLRESGDRDSADSANPESNQPIRRARFFRVNSRINTNPSQTSLQEDDGEEAQEHTGGSNQVAQPGSTNTPGGLLTRRTTESQSSDNHPPDVDNSYTRQRITPNLVPISTLETANPFSITYPPANVQSDSDRLIPTMSPRLNMSLSRAVPSGGTSVARAPTPVLSSRVTGNDSSLTPRPPRDTTVTALASVSSSGVSCATLTPRPPRDSSSITSLTSQAGATTGGRSGNPFTITWPPAGEGVSSGGITHRATGDAGSSPTRRVSRQELRRLGTRRSDRTT